MFAIQTDFNLNNYILISRSFCFAIIFDFYVHFCSNFQSHNPICCLFSYTTCAWSFFFFLLLLLLFYVILVKFWAYIHIFVRLFRCLYVLFALVNPFKKYCVYVRVYVLKISLQFVLFIPSDCRNRSCFYTLCVCIAFSFMIITIIV